MLYSIIVIYFLYFIISVLCETLQSTENIIVNFTSTAMGSNATYQCRDGSSGVYTTQCTSDGVWEPNPNSTLDCTMTDHDVPMQNGVIVAVIILVIVTCITIVVVVVFYWRITKTSELFSMTVLKVLYLYFIIFSEQNREFQLVQLNTQLSGEHKEPNLGTLSAEPSIPWTSAPSHSPLKSPVKVIWHT